MFQDPPLSLWIASRLPSGSHDGVSSLTPGPLVFSIRCSPVWTSTKPICVPRPREPLRKRQFNLRESWTNTRKRRTNRRHNCLTSETLSNAHFETRVLRVEQFVVYRCDHAAGASLRIARAYAP